MTIGGGGVGWLAHWHDNGPITKARFFPVIAQSGIDVVVGVAWYGVKVGYAD